MNYEPYSFSTFVGQERIKKELLAMIANKDDSNIIFRGNYGSGKTTLATIYAAMRGLYTYAVVPQMHKLVLRLDASSHIIDEIHLEDTFERFYDQMKNHTFLFCTTETEKLPAPFLSRCIELVMDDYKEEELVKIIIEYATATKVYIENPAAKIVAERAKFTPRVAIQLLKRLHNMGTLENQLLTGSYVAKTLDSLRVLSNGLTEDDIKYLMVLYELDNTLSLRTLAATINRSESFIRESLEPFLIYKRFVGVTPKGRILLQDGKEVIDDLIKEGVLSYA